MNIYLAFAAALAVYTSFGYELTTSNYYEYPSCKPDCLQNRGGCPNNEPCHQKLDSVYLIEATGNCYLSLSTCWGCLKDEGVSGVDTHLKQVTCPAIPTAEPSAEILECSSISSSDACMVEPDCLWLSFTNPPRCGYMDKCEDNCRACTENNCEQGAGGNCLFNANTNRCFGTLCDNSCQNCLSPHECENSFAAPMGCVIEQENMENCMPLGPTYAPIIAPTSSPTIWTHPRNQWIEWKQQLVEGDSRFIFDLDIEFGREHYILDDGLSLFGKTCTIRRECPKCIESHQVIYYKRISGDCDQMFTLPFIMFHDNFWAEFGFIPNRLNENFLLTNSEEIAMDTVTQSYEDCNGECWDYCNDYSGRAFGDCAPTGPVDGKQFYCEDPDCKSVRWSILF